MCTAITLKTNQFYFGRNLDLEYHYNETVTITPRNLYLPMRCEKPLSDHYAMIGMATVDGAFPLYYEATNEYGLSMAGLNFPGNAVYQDPAEGMYNVTPFELIPWLLGQCKTTREAAERLQNTNIVNIPYSDQFPLTPLHWIVADQEFTIVVEPMQDGLKLYENPFGVLTNNPPFAYHLHNISNFMHLSPRQPENTLCTEIPLSHYSNGMGGIGLPGDLSSTSRFVRAVFTKCNSVCDSDEISSIGQFFHILDSVAMLSGSVQIGTRYEKTVYSSCCNTETGVYYYTTYENRQITGISLKNCKLNSKQLQVFPLVTDQQIRWEN